MSSGPALFRRRATWCACRRAAPTACPARAVALARSASRAVLAALVDLGPIRAWTSPRDRGALLDDPSGLELALGSRGFIHAPSEIGLSGQRSAFATLRLTGERASVPVRLTASTLHADVVVGPKTAIWPFDPIDIEVRLVDDQRLPPPTLRSSRSGVNLDETLVVWRRDGDVYRARLEPRSPPGPWVVRVEVADPYGSELGRGFVEVIAAGKLEESTLTSFRTTASR